MKTLDYLILVIAERAQIQIVTAQIWVYGIMVIGVGLLLAAAKYYKVL